MSEIFIRPAHIEDAPALARVLIRATRDAFRGRVPDRCLDWITPEESAANWAKNFRSEQRLDPGDYLYVADMPGTGVVGLAMVTRITPQDRFALDITRRYFYELRSLQIDPAWQRRGVGRALLARVAAAVLTEGSISLLVRILNESPNRGFYEHLGAIPLGSRPHDWEGHQTEELLFGWPDINKLMNKNDVNGS